MPYAPKNHSFTMLLMFGFRLVFWAACYFLNWSGVFALDKKNRPKNSFPKPGIQTPWDLGLSIRISSDQSSGGSFRDQGDGKTGQITIILKLNSGHFGGDSHTKKHLFVGDPRRFGRYNFPRFQKF